MSAATMNGGDVANKSNSSTPAAASKQQLKNSSSTAKSLDNSRKQTASPVEGQNKKQQQPKAWQGPNPITQRASNNLPNGNEKPLPRLPAQSQSQQSKVTGDLHADKHANERTIFLLSQLIGKDVTITVKNGEQFTGVFSGAALDSSKPQFVIKMARRIATSQQQANGTSDTSGEFVGEGEDYTMSFDKEDIIDLSAQDVSTTAAVHQNGSIEGSFMTDTQISGRDPSMPRERDLQRWEPGPDAALDMSLESSGDTTWDQFAVNERMYGVQSTYDEDLYTTSIDRSRPDYERKKAEADRIAREIEGSAPATAHVAEERRRDADRNDAGDEEEKYSGVKRESGTALPRRTAGAYVPPSQRPITSTPTVPGAPFDPAIISSSIAKPAAAPAPIAETSAPSAPPATAEGSTTAAMTQPPKKRDNTTEDRVRDTADAFKQFANNEKLRIRQVAEAKRANQRQEKNVKLNDLKKFAANFKLKSRVPDDLVPILAKDREKQLEIQAKADQAAKEEEVTKAKDKVSDKAATAVSPAASVATTQVGPATTMDQRVPFNQHRPRPSGQVRGGLAAGHGASPRVPLGQRIQSNNQSFNRGQGMPQPAGLHIQPNAPAPADMPMSPSSATRLNVNAKSFEFRPGASAFTPTGTSPSPQRTGSVGVSPSDTAASFFDRKAKDPKASKGRRNPISRMQKGEYNEQEKKKFGPNGGIPQAYNTLPTWQATKSNENKMFREVYPQAQAPSQGPSPMQTPNPNGQMPHAHQLPAHMQGGPHMSTPNQRPFYPNPSHGHGPSFDPRMQPSFGPNASVQNSPRAQQIPVAPFNGQMPPMPVQQFPGQPMPGYGMSPSMQYRQPSMQGGPPMMMPGQMAGQMGPMQPGYPPGPQFRGPQMGGHMMVQQPSGGYVNGPMPQQGYPSPMPHPAQPHMPHMQQHGGPAGYSASPRPTMMQHTGSHQGFQPGMPMQPHFAPSPGQPHPYHLQQQHRAMSGGFPQMTPRQQHAVPNHSSPGMGGVASQGDEGK